MNNFEVMVVLSKMLGYTRRISIGSRVHYINEALAIDKKDH